MCGEKVSACLPRTLNLGSPPRVRGKEWYLQGESPAPGITPACAGKRRNCPRILRSTRDHPRVCGEKDLEKRNTINYQGSPPRMRGKDFLLFHRLFSQGITPAYAGKSRSRRTTVRPLRDHPRVCGEKHLCSQLERPPPGSPPRVRGKGRPGRLRVWLARITPACAGKSCIACPHSFAFMDHPRVCGEKAVAV